MEVEKHVLGELLRGLPIPEKVQRQAENHRLVTTDDAREVIEPVVSCRWLRPGWFPHVSVFLSL
jgi:hypothetical protein